MPLRNRHFVVDRQWVQVGSGVSDMYRYRSGTPAYQEGGTYDSGNPPYQEGGFLPTTLLSMAAPHVAQAGKKLACRGARATVDKYCPPKKRKARDGQSGSGGKKRKQRGGSVSDWFTDPDTVVSNAIVRNLMRGQRGKGVVSDILSLPAALLKQIGLGRQCRRKKRQQGGRLQLRRQPWDPPVPFLNTPQVGLGQKKKRRRSSRQGHCFSGLP